MTSKIGFYRLRSGHIFNENENAEAEGEVMAM